MRTKILLAASLALTITALPLYAQDAPAIVTRAAPHETFDRIVFDWPRDVQFHMSRDGTQASIIFDATNAIKLNNGMLSDLTRARAFTVHQEDGHVTVSFTVDANATLKIFTNDKSIVVDVTDKAANQKTEAAQEIAKLPEKSQAPPASPSLVSPAPSSPGSSPAAAAPPKTAELLSDKLVADKVIDKSAPENAAPPTAPAVIAKDKPETLLPPAPPAAAQPVTPPSPISVPALVPPTAAPAPTPIQAPPPMAETPAVASPAAKPVSAAAPARPSIALSDIATMVATLDPHIKTRAVIYQRADVGYIIFDRKLTLTPAELENGIPAQIDLQPFDMSKNSGYRFAMPPGADLEATLDGTIWKIFISKKQASLSVTTSLVAQPDFALGARFLLPLPDAPEPIHFIDPIVGDTLILVPLAQSEAFNLERRTPDINILPAAQGLVLRPLSDKVTVRTVSDGIEITTEGGLLLSHASDTGAGSQDVSKARLGQSFRSIFDFTTWAGKPGETFTEARQRLQQTIVDVPEQERDRARLELARFYFAHGDGAEAVSLLNYLVKLVPDLRAHSDYTALLGASEIFAARPEEGLRDLSLPALAEQPEIELWQAVGYAQLRDWPQAEEKFAARKNILMGYPEPFFSRFFVLAVESALATGKDHDAAEWLDYITDTPHESKIEPALLYLHGVMQAKAGHAAKAKEAWKAVEATNDQLYKIRAELALIDLDVSTASLTPAQAADRLEALRFGWRGDDLEVDILHRLGQFYIQAKNIKAGLNAMSQAVTLYPASALTPAIRTEMATIFHDVFLGDLGKKLTPLDNLMLYQQYRDLMPPGKDGDTIRKNLAERLVAVDLLDQASDILEDLARNHLTGEDKDRTALRLAAIRLLDHKPTEAITALDMTGNDTLSTDLQSQRILLRARALAELQKTDEATALLQNNNSPGAKALRADIAMRAQKWADAAKALMDLVGPPPPSSTQLTPDQMTELVNAAMAYALNNDQTGLDKLAIDYGAAMTGTPQNDTFQLLTRPDKTGQPRDLAAAQTQITQVDMFQGFLNNYRSSETASTPASPTPSK